MDEREQQEAFTNELDSLIRRYANDFDMSYQSMVGCLEIEKARLIQDVLED